MKKSKFLIMFKNMIKFYSLFLLILCPIFGEKYPAFIWTNEKETFPQVLAGHSISGKDFQDHYLLNYDNIVVFVRKNLNIGELISSGSVYGCDTDTAYYNLKNIMLNHHSTYLPYVEDIFLSIKNLQKEYRRSTIDGKNDYFITNRILFEGKSILFIKFDNMKLSSVEIDIYIKKINQQLEDMNVKFVAIYTSGYQMPNSIDNSINGAKNIVKRSASIADTNNETNYIIQGKAFLMKVTQLSIDGTNETTINLSKADLSYNDCLPQNITSVNYNCSVDMRLGDINSTMQNVILRINFATSNNPNRGFWYIKSLFLTYINKSEEVMTELDSTFVDMTPIGYSYHCSSQPPPKPVIRSYNETTNENILLTFKELQLQVFMENSTQFGHYNDCVGFFTIPIWMFIISSIVLLSILYFGISMLMSITTMDRYDDPKGKSISVTATD